MYTVRHTLSLHDALPVCYRWFVRRVRGLGLGSLHKEARPRPEVISPIPTTRWGILWLEGGKGTIYSSIYRFDITVVRIEEPVSYRHISGRILDLPQLLHHPAIRCGGGGWRKAKSCHETAGSIAELRLHISGNALHEPAIAPPCILSILRPFVIGPF